MAAWYNEHDPKAAAWLRELIKGGHIAPGVVDERDIQLIQPDEIRGFTQCHFFAGIGGWSVALRLAGWPDDRPVWTGSCPCQPFSIAGSGLGEEDPRHLWPQFCQLIAKCAPPVVFGEQVASADGRQWLAGVRADLEALGLTFGAADLCAAGVGAPHIRQRLYWMGHAHGDGRKAGRSATAGDGHGSAVGSNGGVGGLADNESERRNGRSGMQGTNGRGLIEAGGIVGGMDNSAGARRNGKVERTEGEERHETRLRVPSEAGGPHGGRLAHVPGAGSQERRGGQTDEHAAAKRGGAWSDFDLVPCGDGKARRVESGTFPLAHGVPGRVGLLRGYGNAIVPQLAAEFIQACEEAIGLTDAA